MQPSNLVMRKSVSHPDPDWKRSSGPLNLNTRDELLISLLASQAVVDSGDFEILGSEEVDELKKARLRKLTFRISNYHK
jgi:Up-regulated During Septation